MSSNSINKLPVAHHFNNLLDLQRQIASTPTTPMTPRTPMEHEEQLCQEHNELLHFFCVTCNGLICQTCTISPQHHTHNYNLVSDLVPLARHRIHRKVQDVRKNVQELENSVDIILHREKEIREQGDMIKKQISDRTASIIEILKRNEGALHGEVDGVVATKCKWLAVQRKDVSDTVHEVFRETNGAEHRVETEREEDFLCNQDNILRRLGKVIDRVNALVLSPVEEPNICFISKDNSTDLGNIKTSFMDTNCRVSLGKKASCLIAGIPAKVTVKISTSSRVSPIPLCLINFRIAAMESKKYLPKIITHSSQPEEYVVLFEPQEPGRHDIEVSVGEREVEGSPITMMATYSPELKRRKSQVIAKLSRPYGCVLFEDTLIVAEYGAHRITFVDSAGMKIKAFGSKGSRHGQFTHPRGIALAVDGKSLLVTDNHRIQHLTLDGEVLAVAGDGKNGASRDEFYTPTGIAVNPTDGTIYVADTDNNRIQVLNSNLAVLFSFGCSASISGQLQSPYDVALDNSGNVYVVDGWKHCVKLFSNRGRYLSQISREGYGPGELNWPTAIAVNNNKFLYVTEQDNKRVSIFTGRGEFVSCYDGGSASGFNGPQDIFVDSKGNVYVSDTYDDKIYVYYV